MSFDHFSLTSLDLESFLKSYSLSLSPIIMAYDLFTSNLILEISLLPTNDLCVCVRCAAPVDLNFEHILNLQS